MEKYIETEIGLYVTPRYLGNFCVTFNFNRFSVFLRDGMADKQTNITSLKKFCLKKKHGAKYVLNFNIAMLLLTYY